MLELNLDAVADQQKRTPDTQAEPKVAFLPLLMQNMKCYSSQPVNELAVTCVARLGEQTV